MSIIKKDYKWNGKLTNRSKTNYIVLHHSAMPMNTAEEIHKSHVNKGWTGIGYHFYVRKDGSIYTGRPITAVGAHTVNYNSQSIGICFEGNFETETMCDAQIKAGREVVAYARKQYPNAKIVKHKDLQATACPGKNFPFDKVTQAEAAKELTEANDIVWELMNGKCKIKITEVDKAVKALDNAKTNKEFESLYWILYKIVNGNK